MDSSTPIESNKPTGKGRTTILENDTHYQSISDIYRIYKTSYSKCYDSDEEIFFSDVIHHLEQRSVSSTDEVHLETKYQVEDPILKETLDDIPKWSTDLPNKNGLITAHSLSCRIEEESPLNYLEDLGVEKLDYVKLKVGYIFNSTLERKPQVENPNSDSRSEEPLVLRMIRMKYISMDEYLKWRYKGFRPEELKVKKISDGKISGSLIRITKNEGDQQSQLASNENTHSFSSKSASNYEETRKNDLSTLTDKERYLIALTKYEVWDQELPDAVDILWPGKKDFENFYQNYKNAIIENILYKNFIEKYRSARLELIDDKAKADIKEHFRPYDEDAKATTLTNNLTKPSEAEKETKCQYWNNFKNRFANHELSEKFTQSLFENMLNERIRIEDLNVSSIIKRLQEIHKAKPKGETAKGEDIFWEEVVVFKQSDSLRGISISDESVFNVALIENEEKQLTDDDKIDIVPEFQSMIYVSKVYPDNPLRYTEDKCSWGCRMDNEVQEPSLELVGRCTGYSMLNFRQPEGCLFTLSPKEDNFTSENESTEDSDSISSSDNLSLYSRGDVNEDNYIEFYTDWPNYPYSEIIDTIYHRHHMGYKFIKDIIEVKPNKLNEISRIFHRAGKRSKDECKKSHAVKTSTSCRDSKQEGTENRKNFKPPPDITYYKEEKIISSKSLTKDKLLTIHSNLQVAKEPKSLESCNYLSIESLEIEKDHYKSDSSTDIDNESVINYYENQFENYPASAMSYDNHSSLDSNDYITTDFEDKVITNTCEENNNSDIFNFIKDYSFGYENNKVSTSTCNEVKNIQEVDSTNQSICSDDTLSLRDIKDDLETPLISDAFGKNLQDTFNIELISIIQEKRKLILQEIRTSIPLIYIILNFKTEGLDRLDRLGSLIENKKLLAFTERDYLAIQRKYNQQADEQVTSSLNKIITYDYKYYKFIFKMLQQKVEMIAPVLNNYLIRHLMIKDYLRNNKALSIFINFFDKNDLVFSINKKINLSKYDKIERQVGEFLNRVKKDQIYSTLVYEAAVLHYFSVKNYFTLDQLIRYDKDWKHICSVPRSINKTSMGKLSVDFKDGFIQGNFKYNYLLKKILIQFNNNYMKNNMFRQFLEPELFPSCVKTINSTEFRRILSENCETWCNTILINELEIDLENIMRTIWECELLGINRCRLYKNQFVNRFPTETASYFNTFFPNNIQVLNEKSRKSKENNKIYNGVWQYNREFHYWHCLQQGNKQISKLFLTNSDLFCFEKLLTQCLFKSILTYYEYKFHG